MKVIEDHHLALSIGGRNGEFDKLIEQLEFYHSTLWKKVAFYLLRGLGLALGILALLGLLGVGSWF